MAIVTIYSVTILTSMVFLSILLANFINLITIHAHNNVDHNAYLKMTDTPDHLIWFLQISDIHISIFWDPERIAEFREFCHYTVDAVKPSVVLATGDLTDAKTSDAIGSEQIKDEWIKYKQILEETKMASKTVWLDIRGNHDTFNVLDNHSPSNYFPNYSMQGKQHSRSYMHHVQKGSDLFSFIGIDACLEPGPKRPFNFIGMLDGREIKTVYELIDEAERMGTNYTIWFGHYPTSCILVPGRLHVRRIIGKHKQGLAYVCGHLHQLGGLVPRMYSLQNAGFLELELGDWKNNRMFRVMAIDHGLMSFVDVKHRKWPIILITNPKHALFYNPSKENLNIIRDSTHIRILVFSLASIKEVKVRIDNENWMVCKQKDGPLFVAKWDPNHYLFGIHDIEVEAEDIEGRVFSTSQQFSLDGSKLSFDLLARMALMLNANAMGFYWAMTFVCVAPLFILRYISHVRMARAVRGRCACIKRYLKRLWMLATVDRLFWPLFIYPMYLTMGPWSIGHIIEGHIGYIFAWGIFINGQFIPGAFTYAYGFSQLLIFQLPMMFILGNAVEFRFQQLYKKPGSSKCSTFLFHLPFFLTILLQVLMAILFWMAYGTLAFILGPLRTWSVVLASLLYYLSLALPEKSLSKVSQALNVPSTSERGSGKDS